jgi:hypothetical protein
MDFYCFRCANVIQGNQIFCNNTKCQCGYGTYATWLCENCIKRCQECNTVYSLECWENRNHIQWPCISHRHCSECSYRPQQCNVLPMSACGCGCGDYSPGELIWKSKREKQEYNEYLKDKDRFRK